MEGSIEPIGAAIKRHVQNLLPGVVALQELRKIAEVADFERDEQTRASGDGMAGHGMNIIDSARGTKSIIAEEVKVNLKNSSREVGQVLKPQQVVQLIENPRA